jgi:integrase/recombinase XerD
MDNEKLLEMFFNKMRLKGLSNNSIKGYKHDLEMILREINKNILEIEYKDLNEYFLSMAGNKAPKTISRKMAAIRSLYRFLLKEDLVEKDPTLKLESPKLNKSLPKFMTEDEVEKVIGSANCFRDQVLMRMFYVTGARLAEIQSLNKDDIDWNNKSIKVLGKGSKERIVFFNQELKDMLQKYLNERTDTNPALFIERGGSRLGRRTIEKIVSECGKRAGLKKHVTPHCFRHSLATRLLRNKVQLKEISQLLGHASTSTTEIYARLDLETVRSSYDSVYEKKEGD